LFFPRNDKSCGGGSPEKSLKLSGAVKRYYNAGLNRHARTGGSVSQIPFNWFGSVAVGKEQVCRNLCFFFYSSMDRPR
jgi:hypothetical protein